MDIPVGWAVPQVIAFLMVVARLSGMFLVTPVFSSPMIPGRIKVMALLTLAAMLTPVVAPGGSDVPISAIALVVAIGTEVLVGFALGYAVSLVFAAIQIAASLIDTSIGFSMATIVDPTTRTQGAVLGSFYSMVATLCFLSIGAHQWMLMGFKRSYDTVPIGELPNFAKMMNNVFATFSEIFAMAFQIAAPILITLLLCDVVLGIISRVTPQMNVFFVGVPLKIGVGLAAIIIAMPSFATFFESRISDVIEGAAVVVGGTTERSQPTKASAAVSAARAAEGVSSQDG